MKDINLKIFTILALVLVTVSCSSFDERYKLYISQKDFDSITGYATYADQDRHIVKSPNGNLVNAVNVEPNSIVQDPISGEKFYMPKDPSKPTPELIIHEKKKRNPERVSNGFLKGIIALGGAAAIADAGGSSSQVSDFASSVLNDDYAQASRSSNPASSTSGGVGDGSILGRWIDSRTSNVFVFNSNSGEFIQKKSINGNPGTVTIYFTWSLSADKKRFTMNQNKIILTNSAGHNSTKTLSKSATNPISLHGSYILVNGTRFNKQ